MEGGRVSTRARTVTEALAALRARHGDVELWVSERDGGLVLDLIRVPDGQRRNGLATRALTDLLALADEHGLIVATTPAGVPDGGRMMRDSLLRDWYRRHGFRPNTGRSRDLRFREAFIREPTGGGRA